MKPTEVAARAVFPFAPIELATALIYGTVVPEQSLPRVPEGSTIRTAIERVIASAYVLGPITVSFSGGRDSSAILAIATHVARREGFPLPVPITLRFVEAREADEDRWQQLVLDHLGLKERIVVTVHDELDLIGAVASRVLCRYGPLYPSNAFAHDLIFARSQGATVLTGMGGDELLENSESTRNQLVLSGRVRPTARELGRLGASLAMPRLYVRRRARFVPKLGWLSAAGQSEFARRHAADLMRPHVTWARSLRPHLNARSFAALRRGQESMAQFHGARVELPFVEPTVLAAAAMQGGALGLGGRTNAMRSIAADLLPDRLLSRETKASFGGGYLVRESLQLMRSNAALEVLEGDDALRDLLDIDALRREWKQPHPHFLTTSLVQAAHMSLGNHLPSAQDT